jgi:hypothetical protein
MDGDSDWSSDEPESDPDEGVGDEDVSAPVQQPDMWFDCCDRAGLLLLSAGVEYYQEGIRVEGDEAVCKFVVAMVPCVSEPTPVVRSLHAS